jgi:uncharacterized repeat protein (TIGR01451 family)
MYKFIGLIIASILFFAVSGVSLASGSPTCETTYGSGVVCPKSSSFVVNKYIQLPTKGGDFVDNLTITDPLFTIGQEVMFKIVVKNTGQTRIDKITVVDTLPSELTYVAGPGSFNSSNNTLTITIDNLEAGKDAVYFITTKVVNFTENKCPVNLVVATATNGASSKDTATFCAEKTGVPVAEKPVMKKQPETGPESIVLGLFSAAGAAGVYLRRKFK